MMLLCAGGCHKVALAIHIVATDVHATNSVICLHTRVLAIVQAVGTTCILRMTQPFCHVTA